ncbi:MULTISPECIES: TetR/AcrR family transcriptional regulator [Streptomyces violaceusniger group]|uniref:TetR/AcrR family transcriptional regulator n=2 Tax=Streptomyces javensis TaxID=114698 RepID=A0ABN1WWS2_9ACTN|nr:TetR/AcrR family transcriptional regulator [Streptomyces javensis]MBI0317130.1 TetR/AcrR family transcriptional regulator [Streptomyces javensis]
MARATRTTGTPGTGRPVARHHGNRHGRSEQARLAVLNAADDLLVEKGFAGVTMEGIATRAGVAKQTIYRWWSTKTDVLMDAFLQDVAEDLTVRDGGDLARDLRTYLRELAWFLDASDAGAVFKALIAQAQHDPAFAADFRSRYLDDQRGRDRLPLERAVERGELPPGLDLAAETDQLMGPLYYRVLVTGEPVGQEFTDRLVDAFLHRHGLTAPAKD